jgi:uncharacterized protein (TIGR02246 family)
MTDFVAAETGVRQMHARYANAVWRRDYASFADCWTEDAEWRIRGHVYKGRQEIAEFLERAMDNFHRVIMTFRTPIIDLRDGAAWCRTYVTEQNGFKNGRPGATVGTYYEKVVQGQDGLWRRKWAVFQLHYMGPADLTGDYFEQPDYGAPPAFAPPDAIAPNYSKINQGG